MKTKLIIVVALSLIFMCGCSQNQNIFTPDISSSQVDEISKPESLVSNNGKEKACCEVTRIRYDEFSDKIDNLNVGSFYRVGDKILFHLRYQGMLHLCASRYVKKEYR